MEINRLKTDSDKELDGVWVELGDGAEVLVARMGNPTCAKRFSQLTSKASRGRSVLSEDAQTKVLIEVVAETVFLDFKGLTEDGKALKNSQGQRVKLLSIRDFRDWIIELASDMDHYVMQEQADAEKKPQITSVGGTK